MSKSKPERSQLDEKILNDLTRAMRVMKTRFLLLPPKKGLAKRWALWETTDSEQLKSVLFFEKPNHMTQETHDKMMGNCSIGFSVPNPEPKDE